MSISDQVFTIMRQVVSVVILRKMSLSDSSAFRIRFQELVGLANEIHPSIQICLELSGCPCPARFLAAAPFKGGKRHMLTIFMFRPVSLPAARSKWKGNQFASIVSCCPKTTSWVCHYKSKNIFIAAEVALHLQLPPSKSHMHLRRFYLLHNMLKGSEVNTNITPSK